jgi:sugar phosphate isomerase/epimerase
VKVSTSSETSQAKWASAPDSTTTSARWSRRPKRSPAAWPRPIRAALPQGFREAIFDLGDGEIDFPACHRVLKSISFQGWICVDLDIARRGPKASYQRCGAYIKKTLEPIYV